MNIRHTALVAASSCVLTLAGCGSGHRADPAVAPVSIGGLPHTLVGEDYNSVTLIETDVQGTNITGTFDTTEVKYNSPDHQRATLTGTVKGSQVTLTASFALGSTVFNGTLNGSTLTLQVPQANGQIEDYVLKPGTVDDYNQLVNQMETGGTPTPQPSKFY
ncbi:hypothetical protein EOT10_03120 [Streptomyces antnestii]|uniref:Propionyl-coenzyme A carboxylase BT domain-containing protein n=1 Tax=Streptomyces antnestii TaxID=2494256 RepID=A0A437Q2Y7_9ACTN|nr:hypothetical protein [Streptomyces sp. San01]RVU28866.1 hypothetical protein EOT10_03120 [Streptomyces sp. San01]